VALGLTQSLTEMSNRNVSWGQRRPVRRTDNLTTFMCRLSWNLLEWDFFTFTFPRYSSHILMNLEFPRQIFDKSWNIKFHENPSSRSRVVPYEHTGKKKPNSRFSQFCECAQLTKTSKAQVPSSKPEDAAAVLTLYMQSTNRSEQISQRYLRHHTRPHS
jgi:hypothetical protein